MCQNRQSQTRTTRDFQHHFDKKKASSKTSQTSKRPANAEPRMKPMRDSAHQARPLAQGEPPIPHPAAAHKPKWLKVTLPEDGELQYKQRVVTDKKDKAHYRVETQSLISKLRKLEAEFDTRPNPGQKSKIQAGMTKLKKIAADKGIDIGKHGEIYTAKHREIGNE